MVIKFIVENNCLKRLFKGIVVLENLEYIDIINNILLVFFGFVLWMKKLEVLIIKNNVIKKLLFVIYKCMGL